MMDQFSSRKYVIDTLKESISKVDNLLDLSEDEVISLIEIITIYNFDLKEALIDLLRS